jgi:hypothetical protein
MERFLIAVAIALSGVLAQAAALGLPEERRYVDPFRASH